MDKHKLKRVCLLSALCIAVNIPRIGYFILAPVWLDFFRITSFPWGNLTNHSRSDDVMSVLPLASQEIGVLFLVIGQFGFTALGTGVMLLAMMVMCPGVLTQTDYGYPKRRILLVGFCFGLSTIGINNSISGTRTPPYIQSILTSFIVPIQFVTR